MKKGRGLLVFLDFQSMQKGERESHLRKEKENRHCRFLTRRKRSLPQGEIIEKGKNYPSCPGRRKEKGFSYSGLREGKSLCNCTPDARREKGGKSMVE